eukprot:INCI7656.3.p1 GENE.INCI7656.3~~INCI7656.3.p1  ORF type:complete len:308 (-),score=82.39 INCI7656.3:284-1207(-)
MPNHGVARGVMRAEHKSKRAGLDPNDFEPATTETREAERKLQQLAQFTRDASFPIVQKTYDQQIAEQRQKIMQGLQRAGSDPLGDLAMSKEMMRYHQELEAVRNKGVRVHEFMEDKKKRRKKKHKKSHHKKSRKHDKKKSSKKKRKKSSSSSSKKSKKSHKKRSRRRSDSESNSSSSSESDSDSSASSQSGSSSDDSGTKRKSDRNSTKTAGSLHHTGGSDLGSDDADGKAATEVLAAAQEADEAKRKKAEDIRRQRQLHIEQEKKKELEIFNKRPAHLAEPFSGFKKGYKFLSMGDSGPGYYRDDA